MEVRAGFLIDLKEGGYKKGKSLKIQCLFLSDAEELCRAAPAAPHLVFDDLSQSQVEIHLTFAKELQVAAAAAGLSLALDPVGQLQLDQARLEAHGSHGRSGGRHLDPLGAEREKNPLKIHPKLRAASPPPDTRVHCVP